MVSSIKISKARYDSIRRSGRDDWSVRKTKKGYYATPTVSKKFNYRSIFGVRF